MTVPAVPRIGLALGAGGAKGLAHIVALEAFDQAGIRPAAIAGSSIGAIIGAAYAAGYSAKAIRDHTLKRFRDRTDVMSRLFQARVGSITDIFSGQFGQALQLDAEAILTEFWPASMPDRFSDLRLPFAAISTDYYQRNERVVSSGKLQNAVAASLAIPGLIRPVLLNGRLHIDGAASNPLPFDRMLEPCDYVIAVDVVGGPESSDPTKQPSTIEAALGASQIMQLAITDAKLQRQDTRLVHLIRPRIAGFSALDFFSVGAILKAAEPIRAEIKQILSDQPVS
jgi:NTE family protein